MTEEPVRVLIVDDDALVRAALRLMLADAAGIVITGEAADGADVPAAVAQARPDVVLMDVRMPGVDGIEATARLRGGAVAGRQPPEVLVLTTFDTDDHVLRALRAGAVGYLLKDTPPAEIEAAIRLAAAGEPCLSSDVTRTLIGAALGATSARDERAARATDQLALLTDKEREVAIAIGHGHTNAEIAETLFLSLGTVKSYTSNLLGKLGLNNRTQVALLVHDAGLG